MQNSLISKEINLIAETPLLRESDYHCIPWTINFSVLTLFTYNFYKNSSSYFVNKLCIRNFVEAWARAVTHYLIIKLIFHQMLNNFLFWFQDFVFNVCFQVFWKWYCVGSKISYPRPTLLFRPSDSWNLIFEFFLIFITYL